MEAPATIRAARPNDVPTLCAMKWCLALSESSTHTARAGPADWHRDLFGPHPRFSALVAERAERLVGFATICERFFPGWVGTTLYINDLYVVPEERRRGIGGALLARAAVEAVNRGAAMIELNVREDNSARRLYRKAGFARVKNCATYVLAGQMLLELSQSLESVIGLLG